MKLEQEYKSRIFDAPAIACNSARHFDVGWSAVMKKSAVIASTLAIFVLVGCGAVASEREPEVSGGRFEWASATAKVSP